MDLRQVAGSRPARRSRLLASLLLLIVAVLAGCTPAAPAAEAPGNWHLGWRAETAFGTVSKATTSCRFLARLTATGTRVRAEFADLGGAKGYTIVNASIARPGVPVSLTLLPGSSTPLTFNGRPGATVSPGQKVLTDPVPLNVAPGTAVLVTVTATAGDAFLKSGLVEPGGCSTAAVPGAASAPASAFSTPGNVRWLRSLLVEGSRQRSIVGLGDSMTEGPTWKPGDYFRWTDVVASTGTAIANAGVGGNAITRPGMLGTMPGQQRAVALLAEPNVSDLVLFMGTNDLGFQQTGAQVLNGISDIVANSRRAGVTPWVATVPPRTNWGWTAAQETQRQVVNQALRSAWLGWRGAHLIDVDALLRDPQAIKRLRPAYNSGDGLHPSIVGTRVIGLAVIQALGLSASVPTPSASPTAAASSPAPGASSTPVATTPTPTTPAPTTPDTTTPTPTALDPTALSPAALGPAALDATTSAPTTPAPNSRLSLSPVHPW